MRRRLVLVEWHDHAEGEGPWNSPEDAAALTRVVMQTVGFVLREDDHEIVLTSTEAVNRDDLVGRADVIVKSDKVTVRELRRTRPRSAAGSRAPRPDH